jgi:tRNA(Ile)-lysidine synthase
MARRELGPATLAVVQAVTAALTESDTHLLVACSGGPDSLALAFGALRAATTHGRRLTAVVVDHGLQPGSAVVAERARDQLCDLGYADVVVVPVRIQVADPGGPEAAARQARYAALRAEAATRQATIWLGHTLDDQAESVLLGLARGSGPRSLAGIAPRAAGLVRPLLSLRQAVTDQACTELGLDPWRDPHNADPRFARARVRSRVLPMLEAELGPGVAEALARTAALARDDADLIDQLAAEADPGTDTLDCADLLALPAALRSRVIRRWLIRHGAVEVSALHAASVDALVTRWHGQGEIHLPGVRVTRQDGSLHCRPDEG